MKYQVLKKLKTSTKRIKLCDTLKEAHNVIKNEGANFIELSYIGQFPVYYNDKTKKTYNIQGLHEKLNIVLGLNEKELSEFDFTN